MQCSSFLSSFPLPKFQNSKIEHRGRMSASASCQSLKHRGSEHMNRRFNEYI
jgi:hypothetical protein